jgi:hypothetical protein
LDSGDDGPALTPAVELGALELNSCTAPAAAAAEAVEAAEEDMEVMLDDMLEDMLVVMLYTRTRDTQSRTR